MRFDGRNPPASFYIPPPRVLTSFPESLCLRWRDKQRSWVEVSSNLAVNDIWDEVGYTSLPPSFTFLVQPPGPSCLRSISHHSAQQIINDESNILLLIVISFFFFRPEFEKLTGSEMMETCYLVNELLIGPEEQS